MKRYNNAWRDNHRIVLFPRGLEHLRKVPEGSNALTMTFYTNTPYWKKRGWCGCVIAKHPPLCYTSCDNCLGYGIMPIPLRELGC